MASSTRRPSDSSRAVPFQRATPTARALVIAAAAFACGATALTPSRASAQVAGATSTLRANNSAQGSRAAAAVSPADTLNRITEMLSDGQPVKARAMLKALAASQASVGLSDDEQTRLFRLIRRAEQAVQQADPIEVSLEEAELALGAGHLRDADRHADAVLELDRASADQRAAADAIKMVAAARRTQLAAQLDATLAAATSAFEAARYDEAAIAISTVHRSGLAMSGEQRSVFTGLAGRLSEIEVATGQPLLASDVVTLGVMQPQNPRGEWLVGSTVVLDDSASQPASQPSTQSSGQPAAAAPAAAPTPNPIQQSAAAEAQRLVAEADLAFKERRLNDARTRYTELLKPFYRPHLTADQVLEAEQRLAEAQIELRGGPGDTGDLLGTVNDTRDLARQRLRAEFDNQFERASSLSAEGDFARARELAAQARLTLSGGRDILSVTDFTALEQKVEQLFADIQAGEERRLIEDTAARTRDLAARQAEAQRNQQAERDRKINELLDRIFALQQDQNYERALEEVDQLLFIDPNNKAGQLMKEVLRDSLIYVRYSDAERRNREGIAELAIDNTIAMRPPGVGQVVTYPDDWVEISRIRGGGLQYTETAVNRAVLATLGSTRLPVDFQDATLENVLAFIASFANLDMDVDWQSLESIGVDREAPVSLKLTNVPLETVLEKTLEKASDPASPAGWAVRDGVVTIASDEVIRRDKVLEIYDIRDLLIDIPDYDEPPEFDLNTIFQQGGQGGGGGGGQSPFTIDDEDPDRLTEEELIQQITDIIQANIDQDGWADFGGETGTITDYNGTLIVTNTPANHRAITDLLTRLRAVRNLQINCEARFLVVTEDFFEQIGFDIDVYFGGNSNEFQNLQAFDPTLGLNNLFNFRGGVPTNTLPQVDRGASGATTRTSLNQSVTGGPGPAGGAPLTQGVNQPGTQGDNFSPIGAPGNSLGLVQAIGGGTGFASQVLGVAPAVGVVGRFLDDVQVDFLVEATQADRRSVQLNAPKLTFTNGQRAFVSVATQQSIVTGATPVVAAGAVAFTPQLGVANSGAQLDVSGVISADRRYVTLDVTVILSALDFSPSSGAPAQVPVGGAAGGVGGGAGGGTASITITTPEASISFIRTTVSVPDQGTLLLGGQRIVNEIEAEAGVPVLSKIPILNRFFSNRLETKEESTLLVLIKPTILIQNEQEEKNFPGLLDSRGQ